MARVDWNRKDEKYLVILKDEDDNEIESMVLLGNNCYDIGEKVFAKAAKKNPGVTLEVSPAEWDADTLARVKEIEGRQESVSNLKQKDKKRVKKT